MSTRDEYDPTLFVLERAATVTAALGEFVLGVSKLGATTTGWVQVPMATFSFAEAYEPDDSGTLVYQSQTATVNLSFWQKPTVAPLYPADRVRATYDGKVLFLGTVDRTTTTYAVDPQAHRFGATHRIDFGATLVGSYGAMLGKTVCWTFMPPEPAITRIRRFVTVNGWDD